MTPAGPPLVWDRDGDVWDRQRNGTYNLRAENSDGNLRGWHLSDIENQLGPISTVAPQPADAAE